MKKLLLTGTALAGLAVTPALAADMALKAYPSAAVAPIFTWTGCYIGVHAGAGMMRDSWTDEKGGGGLAGGQLGCNYQTGILVLGLEGEGYWSGMRSRYRSTSSDSEGVTGQQYTTRNKSDFSVAARMGVAYERAFLYGKAGWVWGNFDFNYGEINSNCPNCITTQFGSSTLDGLLLGLGIEYALTNNWTVKGEYNYLNYGSSEVSFNSCRGGTCSPDGTNTYHAEKHIFKIGANYLFKP
jgi:outer membrane immunogenic protein